MRAVIQARYTVQMKKASAMIQHLGRAVGGSRAFFIYRDRRDPGHPHFVACHPPLAEDALLQCLNAKDLVCTAVSSDDSHQAWVGVASDASIENAELAQEMTNVVAESIRKELANLALAGETLVETDRLTGLPNRDTFIAAIEERLEGAAIDPAAGFAVLVVDLDRFHRVNARFGEAGGDALLRAVSERLLEIAGAHAAFVARLGADRFGILLSADATEHATLAVAERIHDWLTPAYVVGSESIFVSASIGVALGDVTTAASNLLHDADLAIAQVKTRGGNSTLIFRAGMDNLPANELARERDVRLAVHRGEFLVHFQPIVDADRGGLHAFEALLRWRNPVEGLLPPSMFLDVLNETGLIDAVGRFVIRESCDHAARWHALSGSLVPVSVNVVPLQIYGDGFCDFVKRTLREAELPPEGLILELTEEALVHDALKAHAVLEELKAIGVRVMIDDFGTGYSSLSYLHDLPVSGIKLDRGFFAAIDSCHKQRAIVSAIVNLAHTMGLIVVAEGIERPQQYTALRELSCDLAQGFHFSRPFDAENATKYLVRELSTSAAA